MLLQDGMGGLQVLLDRGAGRRGWVDVPPLPGALIVNIGDLLEARTLITSTAFFTNLSWCGKPQPSGGMHPTKPRG